MQDNFRDLQSFIEKNPMGAQAIMARWHEISKRYRIPHFERKEDWNRYVEDHPEMHLDHSLWVAKEIEEAYAHLRRDHPEIESNFNPKGFSFNLSVGDLLGGGLGIWMSTRRPELMQYDPKYQMIADQLKREHKEKLLQQRRQQNPNIKEVADTDPEHLDFVYGHMDGRYFSQLHEEAEKRFREGADIVEKDEKKREIKLAQRQKEIERYDKLKTKVIKGAPEHDAAVKRTQDRAYYHARARYLHYQRDEATEEEKSIKFEDIYKQAEERAFEEFVYKHPEKAAEYSLERYKKLSPKIRAAIERVERIKILQKYGETKTIDGQTIEGKQIREVINKSHSQPGNKYDGVPLGEKPQPTTPVLENTKGEPLKPVPFTIATSSEEIKTSPSQQTELKSSQSTIKTSETGSLPSNQQANQNNQSIIVSDRLGRPVAQEPGKPNELELPAKRHLRPTPPSIGLNGIQQQTKAASQSQNTYLQHLSEKPGFDTRIWNRFRRPVPGPRFIASPQNIFSNFIGFPSLPLPSKMKKGLKKFKNALNPGKKRKIKIPKKPPVSINLFSKVFPGRIYLSLFTLMIIFVLGMVFFAMEGGIGGVTPGEAGQGQIQGLTLNKTGPGSVQNGENITYTIKVSYSGTGEIVISDPIPANTTFVSAFPEKYKNENNTISWNLKENPGINTFTLTLRPEKDDIEIKNKVTARLVGSTNTGTGTGEGTGGGGAGGTELYPPLPEFVALMSNQGRKIDVLDVTPGDENSFTQKVIANGGTRLPLAGKEERIKQIYRKALSFRVNPLIVLTTWGTEAFFSFNNLEFGCDPHDSIGGIRGFDLQLNCSAKTWNTHITFFENNISKYQDGRLPHTDPKTQKTCYYTDAFIYAAERYGPTCTAYDKNDHYHQSFTEKYKILLGI